MSQNLDLFGLAIEAPFALCESTTFRPPSWPPPRDWVCVRDSAGAPVTCWGDYIWDFSPWVGTTLRINIGDGPPLSRNSPVLDPVNADILRLLLTLRIWGPRGTKSIQSTASNFFDEFRKMVHVCSRNNIAAYDLQRYPTVLEEIATVISPSKYEYVIYELDRLLDAADLLGFTLVDKAGIQRLKRLQVARITEQTEYIPPRIWAYQVSRFKACIDDYLAYQAKVEECFAFVLNAYLTNYGPSMEGRGCHKNPFWGGGRLNGSRTGRVFHGPFADTAERFGIKNLLEKWSDATTLKKRGLQVFSSYLSSVSFSGMAYVANFTLMRKEEVGSILTDCFQWRDDETFGRVPLIQGATTKTEKDPRAFWVTTPSVELAVRAMKSVARLRSSCVPADVPVSEHLLGWSFEPWANGHRISIEKLRSGLRPRVDAFCHYLNRYPEVLEIDQLRIRESDLKIARAVCPTLNEIEFRLGEPWPIAWHQIRRTGAVNMFASGLISDSSIQFQMKHLSSYMPIYYGRGNASLRFSDELRTILVNAQYEEMSRQLTAAQSDQFISPHGQAHKAMLLAGTGDQAPVSLIQEQDAIRFEKAARKGEISFRRTVLGGCMRNGLCTGDGIISVSDCAGGNDKAPCAYALFDREAATINQKRLNGVIQQLEKIQPNTPRFRALEQEKRGLENYFAYITKT